jgi:chromosome segregation ATPase
MKEKIAAKNSRNKTQRKTTLPKISDLDDQVQKLVKEVTESNARSMDLEMKLTATTQNMETINRDLAANQDVADSLTEALETNNARIQTLADELSLYKAEIQKELHNSDPKNNGVGLLSENLAAANERLESFKAELFRVNESIVLLSAEEKEAHQKLGEQEAGISEARAKIELVANESMPRITNQLDIFGKEFQTWGEKINSLSEAVAGITPKNGSTGNDNGSAEAITELLAAINLRLDTLEKTSTETSAKIAEIQGNVATLSKKLEGVVMDTAVASAEMFEEF